MIRAWLESHGWTWVRDDGDDDLYTKGNPVCMNTAAALFSEITDMEIASPASAALRNCYMLARRQSRRGADAEAWGHILRFCESAGLQPSILRSADDAAPEHSETLDRNLNRSIERVTALMGALDAAGKISAVKQKSVVIKRGSCE